MFVGTYQVPHINNISFLYPPSPLASQFQDVPADIICRNDDLGEACFKPTPSKICHCTRIIDVVAGSVVELVLTHSVTPGNYLTRAKKKKN